VPANDPDAYTVRLSSSSASQVTIYTSSGFQWSKKLRTTTAQAPASGNHLVISNELTGQGTKNGVTVLMDNTTLTSFGPVVSGGPPQGIVVSGGATLLWGVAASTAYYLKWKGLFLICGG